MAARASRASGSAAGGPGVHPAAPWAARTARVAVQAGQRVDRAVVAAASLVAGRWRRSLSFKTVTATTALGLIVVFALGAYMYRQIADGLAQDRISSAIEQTAQQVRATQASFSATVRVDASDLEQQARDLVGQATAQDHSRYVILEPADPGSPDAVVPYQSSGQVYPEDIPKSLTDAINRDPERQKYQVVTLVDRDGRSRIPAVAVAAQVQIPHAGAYDMYFVYPMDREQNTLDIVSRVFAFGGAILVLLVGAIAFVVSRLVVTPVRGAAQFAERLAAGDLDERMRVRRADEVARLATSFNLMADSLQKQIRQLEDLSRVQQRFVSDVSHELRTPLTTIRMAGDLLHSSRRDFEPSVARSAELMHDELDRFEALLADLLEISRFDAGAASLDLETIDIGVCVAHVVDATRVLAAAKSTLVEVRLPDRGCEAEMDPRRVERILRNLLVNAIEYGEGRPVVVRVGVSADAVAVSVRDHGVGLRTGESAEVFNRFWRADPARARTTGGTGLGLAIAIEDARLHHGWLEAVGEPGKGSCFRLTVPRRAGRPVTSTPLPMSLSPYAVPEPPPVGTPPLAAPAGPPVGEHPDGTGARSAPAVPVPADPAVAAPGQLAAPVAGPATGEDVARTRR